MKRIRLLCLIPNLNGGGAERVMLYLLRGLDRRAFDITFGIAKIEGHFAAQIPTDIETIEFGHPRSYNAVPRLARMLRSGKFDVAYSMTAMNLALTLAREISRAKVPIALGARNHYSLSLPAETKNYKIVSRAIRLLYPRANMVIGVAQGVCDDLVHNFGVKPERARAIYNPLDLAKIRTLAAEQPEHPWLAPGRDRPTVVTAGKLMEAKAHKHLIEAFRTVKERTNARLIIAGQGPLRAETEALIARHGLGDDVALVGFQTNPYAFMNKGTVFALSSLWEGFPNVLIEAMASGAPVVSTRCPSGPSEVIQDRQNGLLVPVADPKALGDALTEMLLDAPLRDRLKAESARDAEKYDLPRILSQYASAFEELVAARA